MKPKILIILVTLFLCNCSMFSSQDDVISSESTNSAAEPAAVPDNSASVKDEPVSVMQQPTAAPVQSTKEDLEYLVNDLTFEIKKMSAEMKYLKKQLTDLQANSRMWTNPLAMYDKEIVLRNGTSVFGKIIYQDEKMVKVETLVGYLVLNKDDIVRVINNKPEKPAREYIPEDVAVDLERQQAGPQQPFISAEDEKLQSVTVSTDANCVMVGNVNEKRDVSGNVVFSGEIKNIGATRADFVKINFVFRKNWSGDTQTKTAFVSGSRITFEKSGINSDNSLLPGASGTFKIIIPKSFGSFIGYSYTIEWEQYGE